ncbi:MAG: GGDEF domain-containing protein [Acidobacteria bacterium]|nr:GGDEF domain-containing protein [Acidobacteriota bacterium]
MQHTPRHLRTRVFTITAAGVLLLIGITATLTWRTRAVERRFSTMVMIDLETERALSDLARRTRIIETRVRVAGPESSFGTILADWKLLTEEVREALGDNEEFAIRARVDALDSSMQKVNQSWNGLDRGARQNVLETLRIELTRLADRATAQAEARSDSARAQLDELSRSASNTIWVALGLSWIVAIAAFAIARQLVEKVVRPVEDLAAAAHALASGRLDARAPVRGDAEIAHLGASFNHMARALEASHNALSERAHTDELTGLPNFRTFNQALAAEIDRAQRFEYGFGLLVLDVDHFKQYNDDFGHQAGNDALRLVSRVLLDTIRSIDVPARYGGEEFAVIVPRADSEGLARTAERIRRAIEQSPGILRRRPITVSVGGALYPDDGEQPEALFEKADERLYEAKKAGRNRSALPEHAPLVPHRRKGISRRRA